MKRGGAVYMMTNKYNNVIYTGVTSDIIKRGHQHKTHFYKEGFTSKYKLSKLVYYEVFQKIEDAIFREKQIKNGSRKKKENLINGLNPEWRDLYDDFLT